MGKLKKTSTAQLLWLIGSHYAYLDKWGVQFLYWATLGGFLLWAFADIFRIPSMVIEYNRRVAPGLLRQAIASRLAGGGVSQPVPQVAAPGDNSGRQAAVEHGTTPSPRESSSPRHGLYQAIAFVREHLPLGDVDEKDLNAIEQYFLWNETAVLITRASATTDQTGNKKVALAHTEPSPNSNACSAEIRNRLSSGYLIVTDQRVLYWSANSFEAAFYHDIASIETREIARHSLLEILTSANRIEFEVEEVAFLSRLISTRKDIALRLNSQSTAVAPKRRSRRALN
jgi:hypothetical protein